MSFEERNTWAGLIASVPGVLVYTIWMLVVARDTAVERIDWVWPMVSTIVASILVAIAVSIAWGMAQSRRDPDTDHRSDVRDREIAAQGDRVGQAFLVFGGLAGLVLCAVQAPLFWIANAVYAGFALSAIIGSLARLALYYRGMP
ncbi:MAG: hypothetical protein BGO45_11760 [Microbacterium sp. 71-36]|nr:hypothetical protein [Microbacterium sp.]ODT42143.1 MAG: hypothetical protein ABS60_01415 [Microbacterium sp. SCN 71-17]OJV77435.1 MAG: hypothetical protein BGO45_11760 [Microbacterium sp. 71-36]